LRSIANFQNIRLSKDIPAGRVLTLDIIRGIAIILMTIYHQGLVYSLDGTANNISYFINGWALGRKQVMKNGNSDMIL
jgi:Heparan-alpha-glucosaminide N-acetyltransferase, catalytic